MSFVRLRPLPLIFSGPFPMRSYVSFVTVMTVRMQSSDPINHMDHEKFYGWETFNWPRPCFSYWPGVSTHGNGRFKWPAPATTHTYPLQKWFSARIRNLIFRRQMSVRKRNSQGYACQVTPSCSVRLFSILCMCETETWDASVRTPLAVSI